jgi:tetratricopeptide (TPR) repeat protein
MRVALAAFLLLLLVVSAALAEAQAPQAGQVRAWATRYHEDLPSVDRMRAELTQAVTADPSVDNLVALAEVCFIWGDVRAKTADDKLAAYDQGRQAAKRAVELAPRSVTAHLWYAIDTGRWGQTKGLMRSLSLLPLMREEIDTVLALDPKFPPAYSLAGHFYYEVPGMLGGDVDRAEQLFRTGLGLDPTFTSMRVGLAKTLLKKGRAAEARTELEAVLAEKTPHNLADWTLKDSVEARELLDSIRTRPGG